jgi:hypothetical protein
MGSDDRAGSPSQAFISREGRPPCRPIFLLPAHKPGKGSTRRPDGFWSFYQTNQYGLPCLSVYHFRAEKASTTPSGPPSPVKPTASVNSVSRILWKSSKGRTGTSRPMTPATVSASCLNTAGRSRAPTSAVMWDPQTATWYQGCCRHGMSLNSLPGGMRGYISKLDKEPDFYCFGDNCAEVHCVIRAYTAGRVAPNVDGCFFIAYNSGTRGFIGPCRTCKDWIRFFKGKYYSPSG